jgi:hypothetical protein
LPPRPLAAGACRTALGLTLCVAMTPALVRAQDAGTPPIAEDAIKAGATTRGGAVSGAKIIHVRTLQDSGRGSLREAVNADGPRVIVFDVAGRIDLKSDLKISKPFLTIAGQTAPGPGITLWGASLRIRSHDVVIQHLAVRAGPAATRKENDNRDAISIDGNAKSTVDHHSFQVLLENVSASWSVDEAVSLWYATTRNVTIRHSLIAEALQNAGHPKGSHSMGLLIGTNVQSAEITGNLLVSNAFRNPAVGQGASAFIANNYIFNPGQNAIHFYKIGSQAPTEATIVNNVIEAGPDTKPNLTAVIVPLGQNAAIVDQAFVAGNEALVGPRSKALGYSATLDKAAPAPIWGQERPLPADAVIKDVLAHAGSRPAARDPIDARIVSQVIDKTARIVNTPPEWGSRPGRPVFQKAKVPERPFELAPGTGRTRLEDWLCQRHLAVGGAPSVRCS